MTFSGILPKFCLVNDLKNAFCNRLHDLLELDRQALEDTFKQKHVEQEPFIHKYSFETN